MRMSGSMNTTSTIISLVARVTTPAGDNSGCTHHARPVTRKWDKIPCRTMWMMTTVYALAGCLCCWSSCHVVAGGLTASSSSS